LPSLTDYVLVAQDEARVEHFQRQGDSWLLTAFTALDETLHLAAIESNLPLRLIYGNVEFSPPAARK
ncbi:MAG: Uma2 family endonuclease, partial [Chloroflexota bacterium]|nr:Uma2 family endonuclease [Chloroflexota bacterium]